MRYLITLCCALCLLSACDDMFAVQEEYVENAEKIYAKKADAILPIPGRKRLMLLTMFEKESFGVKNLSVTWGDNNSQMFSVEDTPSELVDIWMLTMGDDDEEIDSTQVTYRSYELMLDNLEEMSYIFEIRSEDADGNTSVPTQIFTSTYGESYESTLNNLFTTDVVKYQDSITIDWSSSKSNMIGTELSYTNGAGEIEIEYLELNESQTTVSDIDVSMGVSYRAMYLPETAMLDTFYTASSVIDLTTIDLTLVD